MRAYPFPVTSAWTSCPDPKVIRFYQALKRARPLARLRLIS
jgi:hypothetical protein